MRQRFFYGDKNRACQTWAARKPEASRSVPAPAWRTTVSSLLKSAASSAALASFGLSASLAALVLFSSVSSKSHWHGLRAACRKKKFRLGDGLDVFESGVGSKLAEKEALGRDVDDCKFGDDMVYDFDAGERQRALFQDFRLVVARGVFHGDEDTFGASDKVHRASHAFEHLAGDGPVRESALFVDLQRAENGEVDVAAANHGERIGGGEISSAGEFRDSFFSGVDEVGIDFGIERIWANAKHAVFGLQNHLHTFGDVVGNERGHADAEIDVVAVAEFQGYPPCNPFAFSFFR